MLLVSCITPSARDWVLDSARSIFPGAREVQLREIDTTIVEESLGTVLGVFGASKTSAHIIGSLASLRDCLALLVAWESDPSEPLIVECERPPGELLGDVTSLRLLLDVAGSAPETRDLASRFLELETACSSGTIEWLVGCPPQSDAVDSLNAQVAIAAGVGLPIRGVVIAPMPRKTDGWPKEFRRAARELAHVAAVRLHPVPVEPSRSGESPVFESPAMDVAEIAVAHDVSGDVLFTMTLPGLGDTRVQVGTWSADPAYPLTHVMVSVNGTIVRRRVDSTVRRCHAVDAVLAGDTITVKFTPHEGQWPVAGEGGS